MKPTQIYQKVDDSLTLSLLPRGVSGREDRRQHAPNGWLAHRFDLLRYTRSLTLTRWSGDQVSTGVTHVPYQKIAEEALAEWRDGSPT